MSAGCVSGTWTYTHAHKYIQSKYFSNALIVLIEDTGKEENYPFPGSCGSALLGPFLEFSCAGLRVLPGFVGE